MKNIILLAAILWLGFSSNGMAQKPDEVEEKISAIIARMTLDEKVAMCHAQSKFSSPGVPRLGIPELWMSDGPHGVRGEINWDNWGYAGWTNDSITAFPALTCLAATFNPQLSYEYGVAIGEEARYRKKDVLLGPGVNIYRTPLNGRNFEYMGEDPLLVSKMVVPYIKGVQSNGVAACVKHFALNNQERWRSHIDVQVSDRALHEIYLPAFKAAVQEGGVWSVMGAYNQFRGQFTSHHELLINKILKGDWAFDGVVITDWGSAHDTKEAALNGLDIEMGTWTNGLTFSESFAYDNYFLAKPFRDMIKSGELSESVVDEKVRRILRLMFRTNMNRERSFGRANNVEHSHVARKVAADGIVLLKNDKGFLPIGEHTDLTIAVIGENATRSMTNGGGSSELKARYEVSPLEGIKQRFKNATIIYSMGYASGPPAYGRELPSGLDADSLSRAAVKAAAEADMVLFIGGLNKNHYQDCEGGDRQHYHLPFGQDELIRRITDVNPQIAVVMVSGNAVEMPWLHDVKGLIQAWYNGSEAGNALADILSGEVNPSGKLPFSYPVKLSDNAAHHFGQLSYPGDSIRQHYQEDILVGYRWHETQQIKPRFAFGYGLSYTQFTISDAGVNAASYLADGTIKVSCTISNEGQKDGAEVVQVYIGKKDSKVKRAVKELKAFEKVYMKAGSITTVELTIPVEQLAFYDESIAGWHIEKGRYQLYVGNASDNCVYQTQFRIK
ncbi:glycoside hydrolase family 3 C-terminal domain-containing protein [Carboxylicivirga mesophila]|uniref:Glycoside hydrolase family 3 C-terminal domain-containing protein n=1 Tax=Carboxylicivirga mesophila TaxID=1166478 RepID=A0ABS5KBQ5_9BACT|nr:glycoside hydrolase family 3 C-terminal domain-containing protein [Carboxylicivirga mesophila]MBS2211966.1 glycoside hydrolase family 3 C-terminal domain-containing protein [Carboxylicivirga mesophila]